MSLHYRKMKTEVEGKRELSLHYWKIEIDSVELANNYLQKCGQESAKQ
ncbi:hypothetical protein [Litchfieldia alkalitelluris]|nr:hypothetical protein [Litchfieldia alkalitelluris]